MFSIENQITGYSFQFRTEKRKLKSNFRKIPFYFRGEGECNKDTWRILGKIQKTTHFVERIQAFLHEIDKFQKRKKKNCLLDQGVGRIH